MTSSSDEPTCKLCGRQFSSKAGLSRHKCPNGFACEFCKVTLSTERLLINHVCEQKRRHLQRDDKSVKLAFFIYQHFYQVAMKRRQPPNYEQFAHSQFYTDFIRFARYLIDLGAISPRHFVDFLLRVEAPIARWTNPVMYATYIRELNKNETPDQAIERSFMLMEQWSVESGEDWRDFFRKLPPPQATLWIINGKISPWLLFTASSAPALMARLNTEQAAMVDQAIDTTYWRAKLARHQPIVDAFRTTLAENGI